MDFPTTIELVWFELKRQKAQLVHNAEVQAVDPDAVTADELWSFIKKALHHCLPEELEAGDCWIALSLAQLSGLILSGAQRADLTSEPWTWKDIAVYPTLC